MASRHDANNRSEVNSFVFCSQFTSSDFAARLCDEDDVIRCIGRIVIRRVGVVRRIDRIAVVV
jgi:hypothetical protein